MMCWDGLTAAQAARIGFGLCLSVCAMLAVGVLAWEAWRAWSADDDSDMDDLTRSANEEG